MIISGINNPYEVYNAERAKRSSIKANKTDNKSDEFQISSKAADFQAVLKAVKTAPDIREQKLADVQKKLESNSGATAADIADRMLANFDFKA